MSQVCKANIYICSAYSSNYFKIKYKEIREFKDAEVQLSIDNTLQSRKATVISE